MAAQRMLTVTGAEAVTPRMRRIAFAGDVAGFMRDDQMHLRLMVPVAGGGIAPRKYTVRRFDAAAGRIEIDFALHDEPGPGAAWGAAARPGDRIAAIGPGGGGFTAAPWCLLLGDEAGLPAIGRIVEGLAPGVRATALIEVDGPADEQAFDVGADAAIRWLHRNGAAAGTTDLLLRGLRDIAFPADPAEISVWAGVEHQAFHAIRDHLRDDLGLPRACHTVVAYWRRDSAQRSLAASLAGLGRRLFGAQAEG
ncbi:siderophore-interacting protein [Zavarzinia compransoris]|uniref:siderophore-interacting protein n=1 Tax=Zavarzinia marina TaxID=2911065 RepID=UPI001F1DD3B8|nr:siderophore-interacting protein [Zavarzinia marina]MCF4165814.1 siderophore-interacting protein [Zavarzinia marina]